MTKLVELLNQKKELDKQIAQMQTELKKQALASVVAQIKEANLDLSDIQKALSQGGKAKRGTSKGIRQGKPMTDGTNVWSGLGRRPAWVKDAQAAGTLKSVEANG